MQKASSNTQALFDCLNSISPFELQESWDNSGLILGGWKRDFSHLYLSLEIDYPLLLQAKEDSMIICHHPLIFSALKTLQDEHHPAKLLRLAIQKNIQIIAMHTNFDKTHFGRYVVEQVLQLPIQSQEGFVVYCKWDSTLPLLLSYLKEKMQIQTLKFTQSFHQRCQNIALVTGAGASLIPSLKEVDCFITGDIKYHEAIAASTMGMHLIDCGHFELERYFGKILAPILTNKGYKAIILDSQNPFSYM